ncbi:2-succinyl-5-enolpyruvyl-6-hydroxy-3-cyclohexene-1-carboxylate synthase [Nocardioides sp.]|uniref:2-succinyl-5-enolpyruvyl-6-hydroxy-3- cyclohexene-1-carboxylate synthase n=1 Tax=Nocardioides sp. TaxID=35761 RepID=UPI002733675B|nr:thiamine pyrophosphate-binding protein [Nocardioides sp.]MDP3894895.1 thiamine pyrophosphate-binding protein [Nocardioides sp.]
MTDPAAVHLARDVVASLVAAGVREVVLAPGSRNAPLAFAVHDAEAAGQLRLHTRFDERTAGFLAVGLTKVGARAAVICTSGTAVANLHPAVLEAAHSGLPLVVVTADRPAHLRGTGASQTTDQVRIFGEMAVFLDLDASSVSSGGTPGARSSASAPDGSASAPSDSASGPGSSASAPDGSASARGEYAAWLASADGPVHLNVQLVPPLVPTGDPAHLVAPEALTRRMLPAHNDREEGQLELGPRTVVVAGDDAGPPARLLAQQAGWPLFAEPTAGCRTGPNALRTYRLLLDGELADRIERVVVAGHPTLSRPVTQLLERAAVEVVSVRAAGCWSRRPFAVDAEHDAVSVTGADDPAWLDEWVEADRARSRAVDALLAGEPDLTPHEVAGAVSAAVPPQGLLFVGASNPIRDLDLMARPYPVGERRKVIANRGLAGIDGTISSAIGAALGRPHGSRNLALMGDLTFLHDATALMIGPAEERPDLTIVVVNDDGGSIFASLEQGDPRYADRYDRLFGTPHGADLAALCAATRTPHWKVDSLVELEHAIASPAGGIEVVEVTVRRDNRRDLDARLRTC